MTFILNTLYTVCVITSRCNWGAAVEADIITEKKLKWTQSGSSSWSGRNRREQLKQMKSGSSSWSWCNQRKQLKQMQLHGEQQLKLMQSERAAKADEIGEQQLKLMQSERAAKADAIGEQQLKREKWEKPHVFYSQTLWRLCWYIWDECNDIVGWAWVSAHAGHGAVSHTYDSSECNVILFPFDFNMVAKV